MPTGWYGLICCVCFEGLTPETCYVDNVKGVWDICKDKNCAELAGFDKEGNGPLN